MPNIKSAKKRMITSEKSRIINKDIKSRLSTLRKDVMSNVESGDLAKSQESFKAYTSCLDKAVKKGVIKANTASRRKSRTALKIKAIA